MRARLARMATKSQSGNPVLEPLFRAVRATHPKADVALLERAYLIAERMHASQTRKSGDPYITHPLAVATILAELGMTEPTCAPRCCTTRSRTRRTRSISCAPTSATRSRQLVDGVTKLDKVKYGDSPRPRRSARWSSR